VSNRAAGSVEANLAGSSTLPFRLLAVVTTFATFAEIVLGGTVRASGSGEACPDWPTCHGNLIPAFNASVLVEYSHRLAASLVSVLIILLLAAAFWFWRQPKYLRILSAVALGLLVLQVLLGAATVLVDLPAQLVTAHLATATVLLGVLTILTLYTFTGRVRGHSPASRSASRATMVVATGTFLLILTGSLVVDGNAGLACSTWPLCNGQLIPPGGQADVDLNVLHRFVALLVGIAIALLAVGAVRLGRERGAFFWTAIVALVIYVVQALVGAANVWLGLATAVRVAHLATAQALWMAAAALTVLGANVDAGLSAEPGESLSRRRLPSAPALNRRPRFGDRVRPSGPPAEGGQS